jgi:hypothetical protein
MIDYAGSLPSFSCVPGRASHDNEMGCQSLFPHRLRVNRVVLTAGGGLNRLKLVRRTRVITSR